MPYSVVDKPNKYFNTILVSGDGTVSKSFTGAGFQPDLVWGKARDSAYNHFWYDSVRGAGAEKELRSSSTSAEGASDNETYGYISSFDSDGFSVTGGTNSAYFNQSAKLFVNWLWKANGTGVSNTSGSITSTVSANTTSGFSVCTFTSPASGGYTFGHGLGVAPSMYIVKQRNGATNWLVYHKSIGATNLLRLNLTDASVSSTAFNNTSPTSTVASLNADVQTGTFVAYCFAEVKGFSKFGSYTGNGSSDGTFIYTGFKPAFILTKKYSEAGDNWVIFDNKRAGYNVTNYRLYPNVSDAEETTVLPVDIVSNGFKFRLGTGNVNNTGQSYIYAAFAENPFVSSKGIACTAR